MSKSGIQGQMTAGQVGRPEAPPFVDSIVWTPRKLATGVAPRVEAELVFGQRALKQVREHASSSPNEPVGGILLGRVREDPTCGRRWVLVEAAVRSKRLLPEDASAEILWAALEEVIEPGRAGELVGWYRTHARTGVYLSEQEARLQETRFGAPWQCAMILAGSAEHPVGGVFQRTEAGALSRSGYSTFFELIDPSSEFTPGWKRTFVGWSNYQTDAAVALAGKGGVSAVIPSGTEAGHEGLEGDPDGPAPGRREPDPTPPPVEPLVPEPAPRRQVVPGKPPVVLEAPGEVASEPPKVVDSEATAPAGVRVTPAPGGGPIPTAGAGTAPKKDSGPADDSDQEEESWSEVQIRRSLSAVGRTLGPSGAGGPAPPPTPEASPVELRNEETETLRPDVAGSESARVEPPAPTPRPKVLRPEPPREEPVGSVPMSLEPVLPEPSDAWSPADGMEAFVGGSRRRRRIPVRALGLAATGLIALLGSGWLVLERVNGARLVSAREGEGATFATEELAVESRSSDGDASMASVTLGQGPLFPRPSGASQAGEAEYLWVGPRLSEGSDAVEAEQPVTGGSPAADGAPDNDGAMPGATGSIDRSVDVAQPTTQGTVDPQAGGPPAADTREQAPPGAEIETEGAAPAAAVEGSVSLNLDGLMLDDPAVAAFEDAAAIFRREVTRYDSLRVAFDDQLAGCNALNLSYRAVTDAYRRLGTRFEAARDHFAGPALQAYRSAGRQVAVIDVHYELSECPPPRGG